MQNNIQSEQYKFPYHYIVSYKEQYFLSKHWYFAPSYLAALNIIVENLKEQQKNSNDQIKCLDIGCGDGALINCLNTINTLENFLFDGMDYDESSLRWARTFNVNNNFIQKTEQIPCQFYNILTAIEVLEHIPIVELNSFICECNRLLVKDGMMIITVPTTNKNLAMKHYQHFNKEILNTYTDKYFKIVKVVYFEKHDVVTKLINFIRMNSVCRIDSPFLNNIILKKFSKVYNDHKNCGRMFAICKKL